MFLGLADTADVFRFLFHVAVSRAHLPRDQLYMTADAGIATGLKCLACVTQGHLIEVTEKT